MKSAPELVYAVVRRIPKGSVLTYKEVARWSGLKSPRQVGRLLHQNKDPLRVPCHRVVSSLGRAAAAYAFGGAALQSRKLRREGIEISNGRVVNLQRYLWHPKKQTRS